MNKHLYKLKYVFTPEPGEFSVDDIRKEKETRPELGACDAFMAASLIYPDDGSLSLQLLSMDGRTQTDMSDHEIFKVWALLSSRLANSTTLHPNKRELCGVTFEVIRSVVVGPRLDDPKGPNDD